MFRVWRGVDRALEANFSERVVVVRNARGNRLAQAVLPGARRRRRHHANRQRLDARRRGVPALVDIVVEDVDFPQRAIRIRDPELGLTRVTTLDALLTLGMHAGRFAAMLNLYK